MEIYLGSIGQYILLSAASRRSFLLLGLYHSLIATALSLSIISLCLQKTSNLMGSFVVDTAAAVLAILFLSWKSRASWLREMTRFAIYTVTDAVAAAASWAILIKTVYSRRRQLYFSISYNRIRRAERPTFHSIIYIYIVRVCVVLGVRCSKNFCACGNEIV